MWCRDFVIMRPFFITNRSGRSFRLERRLIFGVNFWGDRPWITCFRFCHCCSNSFTAAKEKRRHSHHRRACRFGLVWNRADPPGRHWWINLRKNIHHARASVYECVHGVSLCYIPMEGILHEAELSIADLFPELLARSECGFVCWYLLEKDAVFSYYRCSYSETERCQEHKPCIGSADFRFYCLFDYFRRFVKQSFRQKRRTALLLHAAAFTCVCFSAALMPAVTIPLCAIHMLWAIVIDFPSFLQAPQQQSKMHSFMRTSEFSFYKREWNRFISSKAMLLNYIVMGAFSGFFSFQMMNTGIADQHVVYIVISALLLICSPIALLYSLEKNDRMLLITLPIKRRTMLWAKYRFYSGLLAGGFILIAMIMGLISGRPISLLTFCSVWNCCWQGLIFG